MQMQIEEFQKKYLDRLKQEFVSEGEEPIDIFFFHHGLTHETVDPIVHWKHLTNRIREKLVTNVIFRYLTCNCGMHRTLDGIEEGATRMADEICSEMRTLMDKEDNRRYRVHFIVHSLGGLYIRVAIPLLFKRGMLGNETFIPFSLITLESPHCGIKKPSKSGPFDQAYRFFSSGLFHGKTIQQMKLKDKHYPSSTSSSSSTESTQREDSDVIETHPNEEVPYLIKICDEEYLAPLRQFKVLTLIQNIRFAYQVPYTSACVDRKFPYKRSDFKNKFVIDAYDFDSSYRDIMDSCDRHYELHGEDDYDDDSIIIDKKNGCVLYNRIITRLNTLNWRRLNVHFRTKSKDDHFFIQGDMLRNKYFRNWRNSDVDSYVDTITEIIKRDIESAN